MSTAVVEPVKRKSNSVHDNNTIISLTKYARVKSTIGNALIVEDLHNGEEFQIIGRDLQEVCLSADKFSETSVVSKTEMVQKLVESYGRPFTVVFEKANGKTRPLRGRLLSSENLFGRSTVEDLDQPDGKRIRLVDHRTISSLIVDNTLYTLK